MAKSSPPPFELLLDILLLAGVLDAVDLTAIGCCSRLLLAEVLTRVWPRILAGNWATRLASVERRVYHAFMNEKVFSDFVPLAQAGACAVCGWFTCFRHPIDGRHLCVKCGRNAEAAEWTSPLFRFQTVTEEEARRRFCLASTVELGKYLPFVESRLSKYAPNYAESVRAALSASRLTETSGQASTTPSQTGAQRQFLLRDVVCLVFEKFGGPVLMQERIRHRDLPKLEFS